MFYGFVKVFANIILRPVFFFNIKGKENIPPNGKLIICANHSHNWDPLVLSTIFPNEIRWMAKKELFESKILSFILYKLGSFPVDRQGTDIAAVKSALKVLKNNQILGIFPEGTRVDGFNKDNAKPGVAMLALKSQSTVLPIHIDSNYKIFKPVNINIGKPMDLSDDFNKRLSTEEYTEISTKILERIYGLKK